MAALCFKAPFHTHNFTPNIEDLLTGAIIRLIPAHLSTRSLIMQTKFSEDIVPLTDLKINPGKVVNHAKDSHRPILLTSRGRGVAVMQGLDEYEKNEEERAFMRAVTTGMMEIKEGKELELDEVKKKLGIE